MAQVNEKLSKDYIEATLDKYFQNKINEAAEDIYGDFIDYLNEPPDTVGWKEGMFTTTINPSSVVVQFRQQIIECLKEKYITDTIQVSEGSGNYNIIICWKNQV